jgi:hypothetical protein
MEYKISRMQVTFLTILNLCENYYDDIFEIPMHFFVSDIKLVNKTVVITSCLITMHVALVKKW